MLTKEQEKKLIIIRKRFVKKYGASKWQKFQRYTTVLKVSSRDMARFMECSRTTARYWMEEVKKL